MIEEAGLAQGDELTLTVRDVVVEIRHAAPAETALNEAFEWSLMLDVAASKRGDDALAAWLRANSRDI